MGQGDRTMVEELCKDEESRRLLMQEELVLGFTELVCEVMEEQGVDRGELAKRLKVGEEEVERILDGDRNLTIREVADILFAIGYRSMDQVGKVVDR